MFLSGIKVNKRAVLYFFFSFYSLPTKVLPSSFHLGRPSTAWRLLGCKVRVRPTERHLVLPVGVVAGWTHRSVLLVIPAQDEAVLSLHLLHSVFSDLMEQNT